VFLGGLPTTCTETDLRNVFSRFGNVMEVVIMYDQEKKKSRGFGFLSFETEDAVDRCVMEHFVTVNGKQVSKVPNIESVTNRLFFFFFFLVFNYVFAQNLYRLKLRE
jgi:RNA recognition motif-containing protein